MKSATHSQTRRSGKLITNYTVDVKKLYSSLYSVSQKFLKSSPLELFCSIFTQAKYCYVKFCQLIASLYPHIFTNVGQFILIFNKMALIFLKYRFTV